MYCPACRDHRQPGCIGRVAKWAIELGPYAIFYQPRTAIKSQALADFLVDWAETQYMPPTPDSTH